VKLLKIGDFDVNGQPVIYRFNKRLIAGSSKIKPALVVWTPANLQ
jgi:hypothetical protein